MGSGTLTLNTQAIHWPLHFTKGNLGTSMYTTIHAIEHNYPVHLCNSQCESPWSYSGDSDI